MEEKSRGRTSGKTEQGQDKKVCFAEEDQPEEIQAHGTDEQDELDVMRRLEEVKTGKGSAGLVRGGDERRQANEIRGKGIGKGNGGEEKHGEKGGIGSKGTQREG